VSDRVIPHDNEAEQAVLGALLLDNRTIDRVGHLRPADFYRGAHQRIYTAIREVIASGAVADLLSVVDRLRTTGNLDVSGAAAYVAALTSSVPSAANADYYARMVVEASVRRSILDLTQRVIDQAYDQSTPSADIIRHIDQSIATMVSTPSTDRVVSHGDAISALRRDIDARQNQMVTGLQTGFDELDALTNGLNPGDYVVIGARPSVGKTSMALQMASKIAQNGAGVLFVSAEMSERDIEARYVSLETDISTRSVRTGDMSHADLRALVDFAARTWQYPLWIDDTPSPEFGRVDRLIRRMVRDHGVAVAFVDYLSLIQPRLRTRDRHEAMADVSHGFKSLARELSIPIVVLSQLTRESEDRRPQLRDIRESGAIEQDADVIAFLHRTGTTAMQLPRVDLIVAKNRKGPLGDVGLLFDGPKTRFLPYQK